MSKAPFVILWGHLGDNGTYPYWLGFADFVSAYVFLLTCGAACELRELDPRAHRYGRPLITCGKNGRVVKQS